MFQGVYCDLHIRPAYPTPGRGKHLSFSRSLSSDDLNRMAFRGNSVHRNRVKLQSDILLPLFVFARLHLIGLLSCLDFVDLLLCMHLIDPLSCLHLNGLLTCLHLIGFLPCLHFVGFLSRLYLVGSCIL